MEYHKDLFWLLFSSSYLSGICYFILKSRGEVPSTPSLLPYPLYHGGGMTLRVRPRVQCAFSSQNIALRLRWFACLLKSDFELLSHSWWGRASLIWSQGFITPRVKVNKNKQTNRSFFVLINNRSIMFFTFEFLCLSNFVSFVFCFYSSDCFFFLEFF